MNPDYPVYIISKGRHDTPLTANQLDMMNVPYHIVVEPQEADDYARVLGEDKVLVLPFSNLGQGSIPARNWVWDHSMSIGAKRHWIMDDNIHRFQRFDGNDRINVSSGTIFKVMEDFVDRYENIALAGPQYRFFAVENSANPAFIYNTRIYSCLLIDNSLEHRWRGKYNEDTDLSIRALKDGYCTILFVAFLQDKATTLTMKGGNTDNVYVDGDDRLKFAESLRDQHPDVVKVTKRFGRWHHLVNYNKFKYNKLIRKEGIVIPKGVNNFGMKIKYLDDQDINIVESNEQ